MLNENTLKALFHLAESGSFLEAARRMGVSKASLSRYIAQAEKHVGFALFHRNRNASQLTRAGQEFLPVARRLMSDLDLFEMRLNRLRDTGVGTLRIACGPLTTRTLIKPVMSTVLKKWPDLRFQISVSASGEPVDQLQRGNIDLYIGDLTYTPDAENIDIVVVERQPVCFVANIAHEIHEQGVCTLSELLKYPFASPYLHKHWRMVLIRALGGGAHATEWVDALPQIECDDYSLLTGFLSEPDFIVGGMQESFAECLALGVCREIAVRETVSWNICAAKKSSEDTAALNLFWDALIEWNASLRQ